jgi:hypothetical protein
VDPQYFTKPFQLMKTAYYWKKDQNEQEELCLPSDAIEHRDRQARPLVMGLAPNRRTRQEVMARP